MKKQFIILLLASVSFSVFAQNNYYTSVSNQNAVSQNNNYPKNEIRFNLLTGVLALPTIDYEYFIQDNFGVGAFAMAGLDYYAFPINFGLFPYGRLYFGSKPASGFFIEGNAGVISERINNYSYYNDGVSIYSSSKSQNQLGIGLGVAVGYKFLTRNNWVGDVFLGIGRAFGTGGDAAYPRIGISIGKRF